MIFLLFSVSGVSAATLSVTSTGDVQVGAADCSDGCSLREAITATASGDTINFASPLFDTAQTVQLTEGGGGQLSIDKNLTITGKGTRRLTISDDDNSIINLRIFFLNSGFTLNISGITITKGKDSGGGCSGIFNNGGTLTLDGVSVSGNFSAVPALAEFAPKAARRPSSIRVYATTPATP